ncbi:MAG: hypothetical protein ACREOK_05335 [Gemmatimonadaceae bacterium]
MYSHCIFCKGELGTNEAVEPFPIGRHLAFDADKGRLWVICPRCQRWNLTPFEERWEAVEAAERLFRGQKLRAQTDNIGLARLKEGTELVRIGPALRPELAAWRYGRVFLQRLRRSVLLAGGGTAVATAAVVAGAPLAASMAVAAPFVLIPAYIAMMVGLGGLGRWKATRVIGEDGKVLRVVGADMQHVKLLGHDGGDPFRFVLKHSYGRQELTGDRARRALGALLARVNGLGAGPGTVSIASSLVADAGNAETAAAQIARASIPFAEDFERQWTSFQRGEWLTDPLKRDEHGRFFANKEPMRMGPLYRLPRPQRLALEMALHESTEQRALEGELALLEAAWREAEEIAAIADAL